MVWPNTLDGGDVTVVCLQLQKHEVKAFLDSLDLWFKPPVKYRELCRHVYPLRTSPYSNHHFRTGDTNSGFLCMYFIICLFIYFFTSLSCGIGFKLSHLQVMKTATRFPNRHQENPNPQFQLSCTLPRMIYWSPTKQCNVISLDIFSFVRDIALLSSPKIQAEVKKRVSLCCRGPWSLFITFYIII